MVKEQEANGIAAVDRGQVLRAEDRLDSAKEEGQKGGDYNDGTEKERDIKICLRM